MHRSNVKEMSRNRTELDTKWSHPDIDRRLGCVRCAAECPPLIGSRPRAIDPGRDHHLQRGPGAKADCNPQADASVQAQTRTSALADRTCAWGRFRTHSATRQAGAGSTAVFIPMNLPPAICSRAPTMSPFSAEERMSVNRIGATPCLHHVAAPDHRNRKERFQWLKTLLLPLSPYINPKGPGPARSARV
jgi:hypothetical protein